jgi:2-C-methyl-D-erythritol 4-phosphate cytidylyltransferase
MLTSDILDRCMEAVQKEDACVAGMPVKDTIKRVDENEYTEETPDRRFLWQVQTPQTFSYPLILEAYEKLQQQLKEAPEQLPTITDDAMVAEYFLHKKVKLVRGSYENIKITTQEDLLCAELFLKK